MSAPSKWHLAEELSAEGFLLRLTQYPSEWEVGFFRTTSALPCLCNSRYFFARASELDDALQQAYNDARANWPQALAEMQETEDSRPSKALLSNLERALKDPKLADKILQQMNNL